ncbi:MAG: hypothetical protein ACERJ2_11530, partial [Filomicrobium sp.]
TPERFCSSWPEQKCSSDASKKAPRYRGAFLLVASHSSVVGAGGGLDLVRRDRLSKKPDKTNGDEDQT